MSNTSIRPRPDDRRGDPFKVVYEWNNDIGRVLDIGFEMCVSHTQFIDDAGIGSVACDGGNWTSF